MFCMYIYIRVTPLPRRLRGRARPTRYVVRPESLFHYRRPASSSESTSHQRPIGSYSSAMTAGSVHLLEQLLPSASQPTLALLWDPRHADCGCSLSNLAHLKHARRVTFLDFRFDASDRLHNNNNRSKTKTRTKTKRERQTSRMPGWAALPRPVLIPAISASSPRPAMTLGQITRYPQAQSRRPLST